MSRFFLLLVSFVCINITTGQQSLLPAQLVSTARQTTEPTTYSLFSLSATQSRTNLPSELKEYSILSSDRDIRSRILRAENPFISISLPQFNRSTIILDLAEVNPLTEDFVVRSAPSMEVVKVNLGKHYRGIIRGQAKSIAAISIFESEVMGVISHPNASGNMVLGKLGNEDVSILYQDDQIMEKLSHVCATPDDSKVYEDQQLHSDDSNGERALTDCVRLYLEVDNDIYINKGSSNTNVTTFVTGIFNQVSALYANEQINTLVSEVVIWSTPSPYNSTTSIGMLNAFTAYRQGFNGNLAQLLSYKASGGVAYVDGLCRTNPDISMSYAGIGSTYQNVPTFSWTVEVCTHEFGHLFGSQHTHACVWNGNGTAIDGCYAPEGSCPTPPLPTSGGTIMSYCHLTNAGINFANGFGSQPGSVIRNKVIAASCLQACAGGGGGSGGGTPACTQNNLVLTLKLDNYPNETTWNIKNTAGTILFSGGGYTTANSTQTIALCLPTSCFTFTINDAYGDGICCAFGQGFYNIKQGTTTLITGGAFGLTETKSFCATATGSTPTCTDGVKNGSETGIDCGGTTCPACPTCTDGVKNGSETGIDCGGPTCPACPTCNDGIKNGTETGVDCCGSCPACPTCFDGILNNGETGVDCGGPNCAPCNTGGGGSGNVQITNIAGHYFETDWNGWLDGGIDCYRFPGTLSPEGTYSIRLRDNELEQSAMTSQVFVLNTFDSVTVEFKFRATGFETSKDFWLRYYNGTTWTTVKSYVYSTDFLNDQVYTRKVKITGPLSPISQFRFQSDADDNTDVVYIDAVVIKGYKTVAPAASCTDGIKNGTETGVDCGGPSCPACPTCTDGIKNGTETGVDCGGPTCPACTSCSDGIQNNGETGVDCGGPNCAPCNGGGSTTTLLSGHYFETDWDGWLDGGIDCYRYSGTLSPEGLSSIRLRDNTLEASAMTSPTYNLAQYNAVTVTFKFKAEGMENGEDFMIQYYNGSSWSTMASFVAGTDFNNLALYSVTATRSGVLHNNAQFRIMCDASENDDIVYIDAVVISGITGNNMGEIKYVNLIQEAKSYELAPLKANIEVFPNPVSDILYIKNAGNASQISIFSTDGKLMINLSNEEENPSIDISSLPYGLFIIKMDTSTGVLVHKIIKQ